MTPMKRGLALVCLVAVMVAGCSSASANSKLSGVYGSWTPVDAGHGYARFAVTNHGTTSATAKCTVEVRDDFGNLGWDSLVGETIPAGQTKTLRMAISFEGALRVTKGTVKDC
jgi:hypothetical protein